MAKASIDLLIITLSSSSSSSFFFFFFFFFISLSSPQPLPINVWPKPTTFLWPTPTFTPLSPSFQILSPYSSHPHLTSAVARYSALLFSEHYNPIVAPAVNLSVLQPLRTLTLCVADISAPLRHGVDESYTLSIDASAGAAALTSATPWGAMRGLETFLQLSWGDPPVVAGDVYVADRPIFGHRGVMLDTSRNYYPVEDIMRTIDAMGSNKLNVFHWHITDSHSFPIELPSEPKLAEKGAYGEGMRYNAADVAAVVDFGMSRGVRVMPEIDAPAHTGSWAEAYPEIMTCANMFWLPNGPENWPDRLASEPGTGHLNPLDPQTYQVHENVIKDIASLFPDEFLHAGGDEITPGCWNSDPSIQAYLSDGGTLSQLLELFLNLTHPYIVSLNKTVVYWEDILLDSQIRVNSSMISPETTILQTWNSGPNNTKLIVQAGYRVIVSSADFYYLDCGHGDFVGNDSSYDQIGSDVGIGGSWCGPFKTWQRVYDYDITYGLTQVESSLVLGGEVALWSEQADPTVLDARVWPRASALAEALWSGNRDMTGKKRYADATDRLTDWRHRMVGRGINAEPIQPLWCRTHPGMCNLVY
ncbi:beta-hexosaminidase 2-like [Typha angustifolia]|uniref:beta-hexosaminidase 2-like n=1 Tax=Typha angustifolia TaxID=59011 RepID=UPI003C2D3CE8